MGRTGGGLRDHGSGALDDRSRPEGSRRCARRKGGFDARAAAGRALSSGDPTLIDDLAAYCRAGHARVSGAAVAMGLEEPRQAGCRLAEDGSQDQRQQRAQTAAGARLQPAIESQSGRGLEASGPRREVRTHQCQGDCGAGCGPARHLGGHEERADRQLSQRRY